MCVTDVGNSTELNVTYYVRNLFGVKIRFVFKLSTHVLILLIVHQMRVVTAG